MKLAITLAAAVLLCGCSQNPSPTPPPPPPRVSAEWVGDLPGAHIYILTDSVEGGQYLAIARHAQQSGVSINPLIKKP